MAKKKTEKTEEAAKAEEKPEEKAVALPEEEASIEKPKETLAAELG